MKIQSNLLYASTHEWVEQLPGGKVRIGLSDYAQDQLGDLVFVNLPQVGDALEAEGVLGDVESVKAVSDVFSPVAGTVSAINEELLDAPEKINADPYGAWLVELEDVSSLEGLLTPAAYEALCQQA